MGALHQRREEERSELQDELQALHQQLDDSSRGVSEAEAEADVRIATLQAKHEDELRSLHARVAQADGELTARRAAEARAKLELRSRGRAPTQVHC